MMVLGATDRSSCIVSLSKFYSSGDPLFLGDSPSPVFTAVLEKSYVRHGANRRCLQSYKFKPRYFSFSLYDQSDYRNSASIILTPKVVTTWRLMFHTTGSD
jgi:hypothetical protein